MQILNMELVKNPLNWVILFLMVSIAYVGFYYITKPDEDM